MVSRVFVAGMVAGAVVTVAIPATFLVMSGAVRPAASALRRGGGILAEKSREAGAEMMEVVEDFFAELQAGPGKVYEHVPAERREQAAEAPA